MEAQNCNNKYSAEAQKLHNKYTTFPLWKIIKAIEKHQGNLVLVQSYLKAKDQRIKDKTKLSQQDINLLMKQFPKLKPDLVYKKLSKAQTLEDARIVLNDLSKRGRGNKQQSKKQIELTQNKQQQSKRHHRRWPRRHGKQHKKQHNNQNDNHCKQNQNIDTSLIFLEFKKLFPAIDQTFIKHQINKVCKKLKKHVQQLENNNRPQNFQQNVKFISQATGVPCKRVKKQFQELNFNVDGTIQCLISQQGTSIKTIMQLSPQLKDLYIDGNNLLYVNKSIRNITLQKGRSAGSSALSKIINQFNKQLKKNIFLIFDQQRIIQKFEFIKIDVSRPQYPTTDDYLVNISKNMTHQFKQSSLFVTSDNGLLLRLQNQKCQNLMRGKVFMTMLEKTIVNIEQILKL